MDVSQCLGSCMNEIDSEFDGEIVNIYVEAGQPVQYGERLFAIRTK